MSHPERRITIFDHVHMRVRKLTREEMLQRKAEYFENYRLSQVWFWEGVFGLAKLSYKVPLFYAQLIVKGVRYVKPRIKTFVHNRRNSTRK